MFTHSHLRTIFILGVVIIALSLGSGVFGTTSGDDDDHYKPTESCNIVCSSNADCVGYVCSHCSLPVSDDSDGNHQGDGEGEGKSEHEVEGKSEHEVEGKSEHEVEGQNHDGNGQGHGEGDNNNGKGNEDHKRRSLKKRDNDNGNGHGNGNGNDDDDGGNSGKKNGKCTRGAACGKPCADHLDCDQLGSCSVCTNSVCTASDPPCGTLCYTNNDCTNPRCTKCEWPGVCVPSTPCNGPCSHNSDCNRLGLCNSCINHQCVAACGNTCTSNSQCSSSCPVCNGGVCGSTNPTPTPTPTPAPPPVVTPTPTPTPVTPCDNDYLEVTVRVPKSAACKQCKNGGCR